MGSRTLSHTGTACSRHTLETGERECMTLGRFEDISTRFSLARLDLSAHIRLELAEFLLFDRSLSSACMVMHAHNTINMYICVCTHIGVDI